MKVIVEADGGSRGNPGVAGYGAVVLAASGYPDERAVLAERAEAIGHATNNVAEYRGLIAGLEAAAAQGATSAAVRMDSKLVVEQMSGRWKVKHPDMIPLADRARKAATQLGEVSYTWIPRAQNGHADRLANEAMDGTRGQAGASDDGAGQAASATTTADTVRAAPAAAARPAPGWTGATGDPCRLVLLRHGQTALSVERRYSGRGDAPLTETGLAQAAAAARRIGARGGIDAVVSSPLARARATAEAAAASLGVPVRVDDDLIETDFGAWEGLTFREAAQQYPELHAQWLGDPTVAPPQGESFTAVADRVARARARVAAEHPGGTVLVVSHVTPIKLVLRAALDVGYPLLYKLHLDLASLSVAEFYPDGGSSVRLVNDTAHLG
ncbi:bifunctional RNase H/acid phosphatase [Tomitella fengzijianii]|uniref:Bifunctional RNase H/acid phosphatase n=1 Tax=Tomitella fengzijianii TaxID=2597660 RepID=A0A516X4B7_9ACTN|nr:bifunctional RNase H/acid phosphatase [Tomitella fengzijianii]QDQ97929.1 bifunctional RNase H/acid phosphatase [Tomitella fengzijianii]